MEDPASDTTPPSDPFERALAEAIDSLPEPFRDQLATVAVVIQDWPTPEQLEERIQSGQRIVGDPEDCIKGVQKYVDIGCDQVIFGVLASTQPIEFAEHSVDLFGRYVMPHFDKDPVHSTTRMREAAVGLRWGGRPGAAPVGTKA